MSLVVAQGGALCGAPDAPNAVSGELQRLGVAAHDTTDKLWAAIASRLPFEKDKEACQKIDAALSSTFMLTSVESLRDARIHENEVINIVEKCGGNRAWVSRLESLLDYKFQTFSQQRCAPPLSAHLAGRAALSDLSSTVNAPRVFESGGFQRTTYTMSEKLSDRVKRLNMWDTLQIPVEVIKKDLLAVGEPSPKERPGSGAYDANSIVVNACLWFTFAKFGVIDGGRRYLSLLASQCHSAWPAVPFKMWLGKLKNLFAEATKRRAGVSIARIPLGTLHVTDAARPRVAEAQEQSSGVLANVGRIARGREAPR
jgi:hypothetical protein